MGLWGSWARRRTGSLLLPFLRDRSGDLACAASALLAWAFSQGAVRVSSFLFDFSPWTAWLLRYRGWDVYIEGFNFIIHFLSCIRAGVNSFEHGLIYIPDMLPVVNNFDQSAMLCAASMPTHNHVRHQRPAVPSICLCASAMYDTNIQRLQSLVYASNAPRPRASCHAQSKT